MSDRIGTNSEQIYSDEDQAVLDILRMALFDPGRFCPRQYTDHGDVGWPTGKEYEPLHVWQSRAALAALTRHEVLQLMSLSYSPKGSYRVGVRCDNCGAAQTVEIPKGTEVQAYPCPNCGYAALRKAPWG